MAARLVGIDPDRIYRLALGFRGPDGLWRDHPALLTVSPAWVNSSAC
jgi:hypothetical protein